LAVKIVHDDDVARRDRGNERLIDIGLKMALKSN
jgi:hypothetical protein